MLDSLKIAYEPDVEMLRATFDMPEGAIEKFAAAFENGTFKTPGFCQWDTIEGVTTWGEAIIDGQYVQLSAGSEDDKIWISIEPQPGSDLLLDGTIQHDDVAAMWPLFIKPMRKVLEVLS